MARVLKSKIQADKELPYQGSVAEYIHLLSASRQVIERLVINPLFQDTASQTLLHADLQKRDICIVTDLIDWQSTSVEPAFVYANETPDFAACPDRNPLVSNGQEPLAGRNKNG